MTLPAPAGYGMPPTKKSRYELLRSQLDQERSSFIAHWRELANFLLPRRARFDVTENNRGDRRSKNIIDSAASFAVRTLSSGMMSGITSPARPWFRLTTPDLSLNEVGAVKAWLHIVTQRMSMVFTRSNLYNALPTVYKDMGVFGTSAVAVLEDDEQVVRFYPFPIGSYMIANDEKLRVRVFAREFRMTVRQVVQRFGKSEDGKTINWKNISTHVKERWDRSGYEDAVDVINIIQPNENYRADRLETKYKRFSSCYYEKSSAEDKFLEEGGFDEFPILVPRWETSGEDVYGTDCPGMTALGDVKQLQLGEKRGAQGLEKMVNPPLKGPTGLRTSKVSTLPGDITYGEGLDKGFGPIYEVSLALDQLEAKQEQVRYRIRRAFYEDLFLMIATSPALNQLNRDVTAKEIEVRQEEKLVALGPVLEQLNQDLLDPLIDRTFNIMLRRGMIPPPPPELEGQALRVEYISIMAQSQKMVGLSTLDRFADRMLSFAEIDPSVMDKWDRDQYVDEYADMTGVPPSVVVEDEEVAQIRAARAQAAQAQAQAEMLSKAGPGAKALSETDTQKPSALRDLMGEDDGE